MTGESDAADPAAPMLRVVRGEPTPEELAVLTALAAARAPGPEASVAPRPRGAWADPRFGLRAPLHPGPGAWRSTVR